MITIDGTMGEGGGQVLRSSLALSALTNRPLRIEKIRAKREKSGLLRQHLTAVLAMAEVCGANVEGAELGASSLTFRPATVRHGEYQFSVGTAGSATLVFQTVLYPLLMTPGASRLVFEGGTHNKTAPPFDFIERTFLPLLHRMGATVRAKLERPGFYPAGGGRFVVELEGGTALQPLSLRDRGEVHSILLEAQVSKIPQHVAERELASLQERLGELPLDARWKRVESPGPGNVVTATVRCTHVTETLTAFGERGVRAEQVGHRLAGQVRRYLTHGSPVGEHLADQLLIPVSLCGGGEFKTTPLSEHTRTNARVIEKFLPERLSVDEANGMVRGVS